MHRPHLKTPATVTALGLAAVCTVVLTAAGVPAGPSVAVGAALGVLPVWLFARKAAVLLVQLGKSQAAKVLSLLDEHEVPYGFKPPDNTSSMLLTFAILFPLVILFFFWLFKREWLKHFDIFHLVRR